MKWGGVGRIGVYGMMSSNFKYGGQGCHTEEMTLEQRNDGVEGKRVH